MSKICLPAEKMALMCSSTADPTTAYTTMGYWDDFCDRIAKNNPKKLIDSAEMLAKHDAEKATRIVKLARGWIEDQQKEVSTGTYER